MTCSQPLLEVENLRISFQTRRGLVEAVRGVSFSMGRERIGIVGESGSGKTQTGRALLGLTPSNAILSAGRLRFNGADLANLGEEELRSIRGRRVSMILQDPKFSLNPILTVRAQLVEMLKIHGIGTRKEAEAKALGLLDAVGLRDPDNVMSLYPHQLSGGMGQRVMIAMMLMADPDLIVADEPTSALDVTVKLKVLKVLDEMVRSRGMGLVLISHDLNLVAEFCDRILVMYAGQILESLPARELAQARHPYTQGLLAALPSLRHKQEHLDVLRRDEAWKRPVGSIL